MLGRGVWRGGRVGGGRKGGWGGRPWTVAEEGISSARSSGMKESDGADLECSVEVAEVARDVE